MKIKARIIDFLRTVRSFFADFFWAPEHSLNLAIFRVVLCFAIFDSVNPGKILTISQWSTQSRIPPYGWGEIIEWFPAHPTLSLGIIILFYVFGIFSLLGLRTRLSLTIFALSSFYLLTLPQLFGKVNHLHHLIWFLAILVFSPCGDNLSIDSVRSAFSGVKRRDINGQERSIRYGVPLRWVWILMGLIYFFPGFWKLASGGWEWIFSDNLKMIMYHKWYVLGEWTPLFRIDRYPILYQSAAFFTVLFELSFIFLIVTPLTRLLAGVAGITFHGAINIFLDISFSSLVVCYVSLVDWKKAFEYIGQFLPPKLLIYYDPKLRAHRGVIGVLNLFNWADKCIFKLRQEKQGSADQQRFEQKNHGSSAGSRGSVKQTDLEDVEPVLIAKRIPVLWPLIPFAYPFSSSLKKLFSETWSGKITFKCDTKKRTNSNKTSVRSSFYVGLYLVILTASFGFAKIVNGWPVGCYPTFDSIRKPTIASVQLEVSRPQKENLVLTEGEMANLLSFSPVRLRGLIRSIFNADSRKELRERVRGLISMLRKSNARLSEGNIRVYWVEIPVEPGRDKIERKALLTKM